MNIPLAIIISLLLSFCGIYSTALEFSVEDEDERLMHHYERMKGINKQ